LASSAATASDSRRAGSSRIRRSDSGKPSSHASEAAWGRSAAPRHTVARGIRAPGVLPGPPGTRGCSADACPRTSRALDRRPARCSPTRRRASRDRRAVQRRPVRADRRPRRRRRQRRRARARPRSTPRRPRPPPRHARVAPATRHSRAGRS
jgi:hypothetical protein